MILSFYSIKLLGDYKPFIHFFWLVTQSLRVIKPSPVDWELSKRWENDELIIAKLMLYYL